MKLELAQPDKYYAYCSITGEIKFNEVEAVRIEFEGFEEFDFFIWQEVLEDELTLPETHYYINEGTCGYCLNAGIESMYEDWSIEAVRHRLVEKGKDLLIESINKNIARTGLSPRYREAETV